ncbi:MAG: hypothetical protein WD598_13785 [Acidimicrobiia bacterium]
MNRTPLRSRRRIAGVGLALAVTAGSGAAVMASTPAGAREGRDASDRVIVCESGVVSQGDVDTSSAFAVRVAADTPVPAGCREG